MFRSDLMLNAILVFSVESEIYSQKKSIIENKSYFEELLNASIKLIEVKLSHLYSNAKHVLQMLCYARISFDIFMKNNYI